MELINFGPYTRQLETIYQPEICLDVWNRLTGGILWRQELLISPNTSHEEKAVAKIELEAWLVGQASRG